MMATKEVVSRPQARVARAEANYAGSCIIDCDPRNLDYEPGKAAEKKHELRRQLKPTRNRK
jgi:hypothetical protein